MTAKKTRRAMSKARASQLSDSEIEEMVLDLIEERFDEKYRDAAREWLMQAAACHQALLELEIKVQSLDSGSPQGMRRHKAMPDKPPRRKARMREAGVR